MATAVTLFSPIWPNNITNIRLKNGKAVITAIGREKLCPRCKEYWPADSEFFYTTHRNKDGLDNWCKACYREWKAGNALKNKQH